MKRAGAIDVPLLGFSLVLLLVGILMVFSSSFYYALQRFGDQYYFFKRELMWAVIGFIGMMITSRIPYRNWRYLAWPIFLVTLTGLVLIFTPLGKEYNGATRWIELGPLSIMPGEIAKFAVVLVFSTMLANENSRIVNIKELLPFIVVLGLVFGLILKQPNFSTASTIVIVGFLLLFVAELPWFWCQTLGVTGLLGGVMLILFESYRLKRLMTFWDPFHNPSKDGFQVVQSLYALGSGGLFGVGLGESVQNKLYLPEPQNDFILATIGEEFGLLGTLSVILLFAGLVWRGVKIALHAPDRFGFFLATGITATVAFQTVVNIAVATSSMPVTGVPLPFISFGGNNLALLMGQIGILLNISKYSMNGEQS